MKVVTEKVSKRKLHLQRKQMEIFLVTLYSFIVVGSGIFSKSLSIATPNLLFHQYQQV